MSEFLRLLSQALQIEMDANTEHLVGGYADSFENYRHRVGKIEGLKDALRLAEEVEKKLNS